LIAFLNSDQVIFAVISIICFIPSIVVHEVSHAFAALKMGDTTAKDSKRLTLNPMAHVDPFGTVVLPLLLAICGLPVFGYAKPVPYNPNRFRNFKVGEVVTGLAGPASNILMALAAAIVALVVSQFDWVASPVSYWLMSGLYLFIFVNFALAFFNLLPIPPLDGSSVILPLLPRRAYPAWYKIQHYAMPVLLVLVIGVPYITAMFGYQPFNPLLAYIRATAGNLTGLFAPWAGG